MSIRLRKQSKPTDPAAAEPRETSVQPRSDVPAVRTRAGATWFGICVAALMLVVLIIFMMQNTRRVAISFLWLEGTIPLALALLIAGVGVGILVMVIGSTRITQLRHRLSRHRH